MLAFALLAVPAQAFAGGFATPFAASVCGAGTAPFAPPGTDGITVNANWQTGPVNVNLVGGGTNFEWKIDCLAPGGGTSGSGVNGGTAVVSGNGIHTFTHRAQSGVDWSDWVDDTVQIDNSTPTNTTTVGSGWHAGPYSVTLNVADDVSPVHGEYKIDGAGSWTSGTNAVISGTSATHTLDTRAVDSAGNTAVVSFSNIKVDQTVPDDNTTFTSAWQLNHALVTLAATDNGQSGISGMLWQLDNGVVTPANPGDVLDIATQGSHTLKTKAIDAVGNESIWKTTIVNVDKMGPTDNTTGPAGWVNTPTVDVTITGDDGTGSGVVRTEWQLEDMTSHVITTGDVPGSAPITVTVSGDGPHELRTRLTDGMGLTSGWKTTPVNIDTVRPTDATTVSAGWQKQVSIDVPVTGTDATSGIKLLEWKLDGVPGSFVGTTHNVTVAGNGQFILETRVMDNAGNYSVWTPRTIQLDTTAPTNLTPTAPSGWRQTPYSVRLAGTDSPSGTDYVEWKVDGGAPNQGTNNLEVATVSGEGPHLLQTRIKDVAGNDSGWRDENINIDSVKPVANTACPASPIANAHQIPITGTDGTSGISNTAEWSLDSGASHQGMTATIVGIGSHTLKTRIQDVAGNWSDWLPCALTVSGSLPSEDGTPPSDYTTVPSGWRQSPVTVTVNADDGVGTGVDYVEWQIDDQPVQQGAAGSQFTISTDGAHDVRTRATDYAGNASIWNEQTVKIDRTNPVDSSDYPAAFTKSATLKLTATDPTSGVDKIEYRFSSGGAVASVPSGGTVPLGSDGAKTVETRVWDLAGNRTGWVTHNFVLDTLAPTNASGAVPAGWQTSAYSLALSGNDSGSGVDHYEWRVGTGAVQTGSPAVVSADGVQSLQTQVVDKAGNVSGWRTDTVKVDTTKPSNTTAGVTSGWRKTNFTTTVTGSDGTSGVQKVEWRVDGGSITSTPSVTISTTGAHLFESRVTDVAGNVSDWLPATIGIDKVAPTLNVSCGALAWRSTAATCTVTASGGESGLPTLTAQRGSAVAEDIGGTYTVDADGRWTINFRAVDGAGNETTAHADVQIDRAPPTVSVTCKASANGGYVCSAAGSDSGSGVSALSYSVDGGPATAVGGGGTFNVEKGNVVVIATDAAGNTGTSKPQSLADRTKNGGSGGSGSGSGSSGGGSSSVTPRATTSAVLAAHGGSTSKRLLGQLAISATPTKTTVDLRPLALGKGKFQFVIKVTVGKKTKTFTKTQTTKKGYSTRISVSTSAGASAKVSLTVRKRSGSRWSSFASASAKL